MNYGKKGVRERQMALNSKSMKWGRKIALYCVKIGLLGIISIGILGCAAGIGMFKGIIDSAPDINPDDVAPSGYSSFVYDNEGRQTAKLVASNSNRIPVGMEKIPENLAHAFVAIEDSRFYEHNGIDIKGILRAGVTAIQTRFQRMEGASTITQQLLKNTIFTDWMEEDGLIDSVKRKIQEQYLALEITKKLSKDEVLLRYMNTINLGQNTLGVQAASLRYFNKDVSELTLSECAVIAAITQNPSRYNPITKPENNAERRQKVLDDMLEQGWITQAEHDEAMADDVYSRIQETNIVVQENETTSYFVDAVTDQVYDDLLAAGYSDTAAFSLIYSGGIQIYSTQDSAIQRIADDVFSNEENYPSDAKWYLTYALTIELDNEEQMNFSSEMFRTYFQENVRKSFDMIFDSQDDAYEYIETYKEAMLAEHGGEVLAESVSMTPQPQVSLTVEDHGTGYVVAMVGGRGSKEGSRTLNRATSTVRQPGSTFKVLAAFAPALDSAGLTLATVINDAPFNYTDGTPVSNWYDTGYRGLSTLRLGIQDSMNIVAVKTLTLISPQLGYDYLLNFGFSTLESSKEINGQIFTDIQQPLALGGITNGVTNLELNAAYATIANQGTYIEPKLYTKVLDRNGNILLDNTEPSSHQVIKETTAFLLTDAMVDVVTKGSGASANFGNMAIAGKTGTTTGDNDVWFCGYTPYYTASVWIGFDNNAKLSSKRGETTLARRLWRLVMEEVHKDLPNQAFPVPSTGLVQATVCSRSGKLPISGWCDGTLATEWFAEGTVPTDTCDVHYQGMICSYSNLPACETCPFRYAGVLELIPVEDPVLQSGSATLTSGLVNPIATNNVTIDPLTGEEITTAVITNQCPHDAAFFQNPDYQSILDQQMAEMNQRNIEAQQAAEAAAAAQPQ